MNCSLSLLHRGAFLVALLGLPLAAQAQTAADALRFSERSGAVGPRMIGLAGAGTAGFADPGALFANPAGLGFYKMSELSGALGFSAVGDNATYRVGGEQTMFDAQLENTRLDHLAYVARMPTARGALVFAAAYQQTNLFDRDLSYRGTTDASSISGTFLPTPGEYEINDAGNAVFFNDPSFIAYNAGLIEYLPENLPDNAYPFYEAVKPGSTIEQRGQVLEQGVMQELAIGGAVAAARDVMLGLSTNLNFGRYRFNSRYEEFDINGENTPDDYVVLLDNRELRGFESLRITDRIESNLFGINFRGGLSARVSGAPLRIGVTVESPTWYAVSEEYSTEMETIFDEGGSLVYGGVDDEAGLGSFEYTLRTPWRFGVGVAFTQGPVLLSADVESVNWQELSFDADGFYDALDDANAQIRDSYRRVFNTRVGAEYEFGPLGFRAGFAYQPDAREQRDVFASAAGPNRSRTILSTGISYRIGRGTYLDLGWMHTAFDDTYDVYQGRFIQEVRADGSGVDAITDESFYPSISESVTRDRISFGLRVAL